jgi:hypothetical protein
MWVVHSVEPSLTALIGSLGFTRIAFCVYFPANSDYQLVASAAFLVVVRRQTSMIGGIRISGAPMAPLPTGKAALQCRACGTTILNKPTVRCQEAAIQQAPKALSALAGVSCLQDMRETGSNQSTASITSIISMNGATRLCV